MNVSGSNSLGSRRKLQVGGISYDYFSLPHAAQALGLGDLSRLPYSLKVLFENLARLENGRTVTTDDIKAMGQWLQDRSSTREIAYRPARVLMQDFTGVPAVVDLAAMRHAVAELGGDPTHINPLSPVDLVIDHSVTVDAYGSPGAFASNVDLEYQRNGERYTFLNWGQKAFDNFRVVPPGTGICHQVDLEYLSQVVWTAQEDDGSIVAYPDTLVGTDSHTPMVNGLAVLGWGVGGIEAEAVMLGQPMSMVIPEVVGVKLTGKLPEGATATDLVLTITRMLRDYGVVGRFVEYFGPGIASLSIADRSTIGNMSPEYGATCGFFPIDRETLNYLTFSGRDPQRVALVEAYAKEQGMWHDETTAEPLFTDVLELDLSEIEPSLAGPRRPQDRVPLSEACRAFEQELPKLVRCEAGDARLNTETEVAGADFKLKHGDVVIAAITSCTNTSNPSVMLGAGLLAKKAVEKGLKAKPWVKTSLAPGSQVVTDYYKAAGLQEPLDQLGFNLVGYGCTTCIGNSGPLPEPIAEAVEAGDLVVGAVLSGNRNFEGRINPHVRANYLASPPLVVAYAIAGSITHDMINDPLGNDGQGKPVYLRDIWPSSAEVNAAIANNVTAEMFRNRYSDVFQGDEHWRKIGTTAGLTYDWQEDSTYIKLPPYFEGMSRDLTPLADITNARPLAMLGDSITTDHISPAGSIRKDSPAGKYLIEHGVSPADFNSYGARRGNHEVMMRGTFANIRLRNELAPGTEGGVTRHMPGGETMAIYDAAMRYKQEGVPLVIIAGKEYGSGSSRDWAAKGTTLLGVKAVVAESYERIHRANLVGMGVLPLVFQHGVTRHSLGLDGSETFDIGGIADQTCLKPRSTLTLRIRRADGSSEDVPVLCRIDTVDEAEYFRHGGIMAFVLRRLMGWI